MDQQKLLILDHLHYTERVGHLFRKLNESTEFRRHFLDDPSGVITDHILEGFDRPSDADINRSNRLLFALHGSEKHLLLGPELSDRSWIIDRALIYHSIAP